MGGKIRKRKGMYRYLTFGLLTLLISTSCAVSPFEESGKAYERGDYATAFRLMKPLAEQGDAQAQFNLGLLYNKGQGVPQDYAEAAKWYLKAAEAKQRGVLRAIAQAQCNLGILYYNGQGVPQDYAEAAKWYLKASERNNAQAQLTLGMMHADGQGVPQDYVLAHMWLGLAASGSRASEANFREMAIKTRDLLAPKMTPEQIAEAERMTRGLTH